MMKNLKEKLKSLIPDSEYAASRREIVCRCPFCGHTSSRHKKHLYISVRDDKPLMYNCFKCNESGLLDQGILNLLGIKDAAIITQVKSFNREKLLENKKYIVARDYNNSYSSYNRYKYNYRQSITKLPDNIIQEKLDYLNNRIGANLDILQWMNHKVILDIDVFYNYIKNVFKVSDRDMQTIRNEYIGFISVDNSFISLRHIKNNDLPRWLIVNVSNDVETAILNKAYGIPTIVTPDTDTIYISEGQFDILSIYYNLTNQAPGIYISASGSRYSSTLEYCVQKFSLMNVNLEIYFDNDDAGASSQEYMRYYISKFRHIYNGRVRFHINKKEKDFGVPLDRIDEHIIKLY